MRGFLLTLRLSFKRNVYQVVVFSSRFVNSFTKEDWRRMSLISLEERRLVALAYLSYSELELI